MPHKSAHQILAQQGRRSYTYSCTSLLLATQLVARVDQRQDLAESSASSVGQAHLFHVLFHAQREISGRLL